MAGEISARKSQSLLGGGQPVRCMIADQHDAGLEPTLDRLDRLGGRIFRRSAALDQWFFRFEHEISPSFAQVSVASDNENCAKVGRAPRRGSCATGTCGSSDLLMDRCASLPSPCPSTSTAPDPARPCLHPVTNCPDTGACFKKSCSTFSARAPTYPLGVYSHQPDLSIRSGEARGLAVRQTSPDRKERDD